jgi:beta-galactosidase/beta-glucuronidase
MSKSTKVLFVLLSLSSPALSRVTVSFNLGWRFHRGLPTPPVCTDPFLQNYTGKQCSGLGFVDSISSASQCQDACCDDSTCEIWQWSDLPLPTGGCWIGQIPPSGCGPGTSWISFANTTRNGGGGNVPDWAFLNYSDSSSNWTVVDAPHDFIITGANETEDPYVDDPSLQGQAFIPKAVGVYRKHFSLPSSWEGQHIDIYMEGMYASATYYLNGVALGSHALGYTSYFTRIDNVTKLFYNNSQDNVLAVFVDATLARDTGWWYEGGGLIRPAFLFSSSSEAHVTPHGLHEDFTVNGEYHPSENPADGVTADGVTALAFVEVETDNGASTEIIATFTLLAADGVTIVAKASSQKLTVPANSRATTNALLSLPDGAQAWSVGRPYLHTLSVSLALASAPTVSIDSTNVTVGIRGIRWDADYGSFVNEQRVRLRAFCDHESFTAVGAAIPKRLQLFRFQAQRGMGGNGRRFSHNPPAPDLLNIADRLGILTLDENRVFSIGLDSNMADLVSRDRNHPSVMFWSFCNEPGCNNGDKTAPTEPTQSFKYQVEVFDGTRAVTGNMCIGWGSCPDLSSYISETGLNMSLQLDVQGFSHVSASAFEAYHSRWPAKPLVASECCSCETMRGEANDLPMNSSLVFYSEFNAPCQASQTQDALGLPYVAGSFVWTAFDYYGVSLFCCCL